MGSSTRPRTGLSPLVALRQRGVSGYLIAIGLAVLAAGPIMLVALNSVTVTPPEATERLGLDAWRSVLSSPSLARVMGNTVGLVLVRVLLGTVIAVFIVWLLTRTDMPGRPFVELILWVAFFLPTLPMALGWILLLDPSFGLVNEGWRALTGADGALLNIYSYWGIVFVHLTLTTVPVMVILLAPAFRLVSGALEDSARVTGSRPMRILRTITLPLVAPTVGVALLLSIVRGLESFEIEKLLGTPAGIDIYSTRIYDSVRFEPPRFAEAAVLGVLLLAATLLMLFIFRRYARSRAFETVGGRGFAPQVTRLGRWRWVAFSFCMLFIGIGVLLPFGVLAVGTFMKLFGFFTIPSPFTLDNWSRVFADPGFTNSVRTTLTLGITAAVVGTLAFSALAYVLVRRRVRATGAIDFFTWLPWFLPGILLGLGLLWAFLANPVLRPFYGSVWLMVLAIAIAQMPVAVQILKGSMGQISVDLEDASRMVGASGARTFFRVIFPLIAPTAVSIGVLIFVAAVRDVSTVVLLSTGGVMPMSVLVLQHSLRGSMEAAAAIGLLVALMVVIVALIGRRFGMGLSAR